MTIGIIGAMPSELAYIREVLGGGNSTEIINYNGFDFYVNCTPAEFNGKSQEIDFIREKMSDKKNKLINVCSGIGKVNSALATQILIDNFKPDYVINCGIAGGMRSVVKKAVVSDNGEIIQPEIFTDVNILDLVIASAVCYHDMELRFLKNYPPYHAIFETSEKLVKLTVEVCKELSSIFVSADDTKAVFCDEYNCSIGRIVSGDQFINSKQVKDDITERLSEPCDGKQATGETADWKTLGVNSVMAVDMESASVGHCCHINKIPFVSIRCISDNADESADMSFEQFEVQAAKKVANVVLGICSNL